MRLPLCAYCHSVDAFAWEVIGSVAGVIAAAAAVIALLPRPRRHKEIPAPPDQAASIVTPAGTSKDVPVMVGDIPREPLGFQPRIDLLAALDAPDPRSRVAVVHALTGLRGVGKTHLAAAYARAKLAERWRLVAWINAEDLGGILTGLAEVAAALEPGTGQRDAKSAARAVRRRMEIDGERCLLVFDNAADPELMQPFIPATGAARVIITSNHLSMANLGAGVPVDVFTQDEALAFLAERTGPADTQGAGLVAAELGYLPLALAQAAAVIASQHLSYSTYLERLRRLPAADLLDAEEAGQYPHGVAATVLLSLDTVRAGEQGGACDAVMDLVAVLSAAGVRRSLIQAGAREGLTGRDGPVAALAPETVDRVLARLAGASLLTFSLDGSAVSAHRLVTRVIRENLAADGALIAVCQVAAQLLDRLAGSWNESWHQDRAATRDLVEHIMALDESSARRPPGSDLDTRMIQLRGWALWFLNQLHDSAAQAIVLGERLVADRVQAFGPDHPDTLTSRNDLATAYRDAGRLDRAVPLYERNLADRERVLGETHPDTLASRNSLAFVYRSEGRLDQAVPLLERTLADRERVLGETHPSTLASRNDLATAYRDAGRLDQAVSLYERNLADCERVLGEIHPHTLASRNNLANAYRAEGRLDRAVPLLERTLADRERVLGETHPDTLASRNNLANAYRDAGRLDRAVPLLERTLADRERVLGETHPGTLASRNNLANAYRAEGRLDQAVPLLERTLADRERVLGETHRDTLASRNNLANAYRDAGRLDQAVPLLERTLADRERVLGETHPSTLASRNNLASAYQDAGRLDEAEGLQNRTGSGA